MNIPDDGLRLLERWLQLSKEEKSRQFADTASAAEVAGVSQRTIQNWIDSGSVAAIRVGKKFRVSLLSLKESLLKRASK